MSFNFGGSGYLVRRQSTALYGMTGYSARADGMYRLTKRFSLGGTYNFTHFDYLRVFGAADFHSVGAVVSYAFSKRAEITLQGGVSRVETLLLQVVTVDPVVAAITGQTSGLVAGYGLNYTPQLGARFAYGLRRSRFEATYNQGVSPGNGFYLTSRQDTVTAQYSYSGIRTWTVHALGTYTSLGGLAATVANYHMYSAGVNADHSFRGSPIALTMGVFVNVYNVGGGTYNGNQFRASVGLAYSPGQIPVRLW